MLFNTHTRWPNPKRFTWKYPALLLQRIAHYVQTGSQHISETELPWGPPKFCRGSGCVTTWFGTIASAVAAQVLSLVASRKAGHESQNVSLSNLCLYA